MESNRVLLIGATSGIGRALGDRLAQRSHRLVLAGRDADSLSEIASDLQARFDLSVATEVFEALDFASHTAFLTRCKSHFGPFDGVVICHGTLPDPREAETHFEVAHRTIEINFSSIVSLLTPIANEMQEQGTGWIAVVSSVAGDRGRQSNYIYGASKAALSAYLQGLRNRLFRHGVHVVTVKPGFVYTAMIENAVDPNSLLVASASQVAAEIDRAIVRRRNVLYTPWFWLPIMAVVRWLPESVFKRLRY